MTYLTIIFSTFLALITRNGLAAETAEHTLSANFSIEENTGRSGILIHPRIISNQDADVRYALYVNKCGKAGTSRHANKGNIHLQAEHEQAIGTIIRLPSVTQQDVVNMSLEIYKDEKLVGKFSERYPGNAKHCN